MTYAVQLQAAMQLFWIAGWRGDAALEMAEIYVRGDAK